MTRRTNPNTVKKEAQLQQAIAAYRNKEKTASSAIRDLAEHSSLDWPVLLLAI
jgi:hypothetical protein